MALTFPLVMPPGGVARQSFEVVRYDALSPDGAGRLNGSTSGSPLWGMRVSLADTTGDESDKWRAFLTALRGQQNYLFGCDLTRLRPKAYVDGFTGDFDGVATAWATDSDWDTLTLTVPEGTVISLGDYVGFRWLATSSSYTLGTSYALVRAVEAATAGSGGTASFAIEPPLPRTVVPDTAVAYLDSPVCLMKAPASKLNLPELDVLHSIGASFEALQDLVP